MDVGTDERRNTSSGWGQLRILAGLMAIAFAITLAAIIGDRLSDEALAVLAGAVCGVGAAIPTSLLIVAVTRRRDEPREQTTTYRPPLSQSTYPPVVVVTPPNAQQRANDWNTFPSSLGAPTQRHFTVVGGPPAD